MNNKDALLKKNLSTLESQKNKNESSFTHKNEMNNVYINPNSNVLNVMML